ncbi:MAG: tRNA preQ1(34) S-adenosylmethionine ribosyltransferase-isomerase QueA [Acidobacteriota bacterium]
MKLSDFEFSLPERLIAQHPLPRRDQSRLMVVDRSSGQVEHSIFRDLPEILGHRHFLVLNNTRVFPARLWGRRPDKDETIEVLLVQEVEKNLWRALVRPARKTPVGQVIEFGDLRASVEESLDDGSRLLRFRGITDLMARLDRIGETPLPPYIRRPAGHHSPEDQERYQTVYAARTGSVAAPTAGLHFTPEVLSALRRREVGTCEILLHVGYGTFKPIRYKEIENHQMDGEYFEVGPQAAGCISRYRKYGRRLIAVGTTVTRVLEHLGLQGGIPGHGSSGVCDLFIYPGHTFRLIDGLLTNFHLPGSTLFVLVCAFAGRDLMLECYRDAIDRQYRFFSYGDCMLIL